MDFPGKTHLSDGDKIDRIMRGFRFENVGFAETSPVIAALKLDGHIPVLANYKMTLAGIDIAFACIPLPKTHHDPLEVITLLNTPGEEPLLFKIRVEDLLKEIDPLTHPIERNVIAVKPDTAGDLKTKLTTPVAPRLKHFQA